MNLFPWMKVTQSPLEWFLQQRKVLLLLPTTTSTTDTNKSKYLRQEKAEEKVNKWNAIPRPINLLNLSCLRCILYARIHANRYLPTYTLFRLLLSLSLLPFCLHHAYFHTHTRKHKGIQWNIHPLCIHGSTKSYLHTLFQYLNKWVQALLNK